MGWVKSSTGSSLATVQHRVGLADVGPQRRRVRVVAQDVQAILDRDAFVVHIQDPSVRNDGLGDLVHITGRRDTGPEVDELMDAVGDQVADDTLEKFPVHARGHAGVGHGADGVFRGDPVAGEVVGAAEQEVIDACRTSHVGDRAVGAEQAGVLRRRGLGVLGGGGGHSVVLRVSGGTGGRLAASWVLPGGQPVDDQ